MTTISAVIPVSALHTQRASASAEKFDPATGEFIINPASGKPLKDENGNVVIDPETGKPKKDPKTQDSV